MDTQVQEISTLPNVAVSSADGDEIKRTNKKRNIPIADIIISDLCHTVHTNWAKSTLTLEWKSIEVFRANITAYDEALYAKKDSSSSRSPLSARTSEIEKEVVKTVEYVKSAIAQKFGKKGAIAYYPDFEIVKTSGSYKLPTGKPERLAGMRKLISGLIKYEMAEINYGLDYWTALADEYETLITSSKESAGNISIKASDKNILKTELRKTLNALILLIKANFPDNYAAVLRQWGFLKENN